MTRVCTSILAVALTVGCLPSGKPDPAVTAIASSAGTKCALQPALACIWGADGWAGYRDCVWRQAAPCIGEHLVTLVPVAVDYAMSGRRLQMSGVQMQLSYLAQADACVMALPEPTVYECRNHALDRCGSERIAWCVDEAARGAAGVRE